MLLLAASRPVCAFSRQFLKPLSPAISQVAHLSGGSSVTHWKVERYVSVLTFGAMVGAAVVPCLAVDHSLAILVPLHTHWGIEQILTDYVHGKATSKICQILLYIVTGFTILSLMYFNQHDIGITQAVKDVWNIKKVNPGELS